MASRPSLRNPAATLPGEADILARVISDLRDDTAKLVYADWLDERGDPRGAFLREFVAAEHGGTKKRPASKGMLAGWRNVVGITLLEEIRKAGLTAWKDTILGLARPAIAIGTKPAPVDSVPVGASKFGGRPDLPGEVPWPTHRNRPLGFLTQISLAELAPAVAGRDLPPTGLLSFFGSAEEAVSTSVVGEEAEWRLIFTPSLAGLKRRYPPSPLGKYDDHPECQLDFSECLDLPALCSSQAVESGLDSDDWREHYHSLLWKIRSSHHHLFGYARGPTLGYDPLPGPDWQHLLSLGREKNVRWGWGDSSVMFWFVTKAGLWARQLDDVKLDSG